jgi:hypothetical protein
MYDEVGGHWYGRATPIGGRSVDPKTGAQLDPDGTAALELLSGGAKLPVGRTWIDLQVYPAAPEAPSTGLIVAEGCCEEVDAEETEKTAKKVTRE